MQGYKAMKWEKGACLQFAFRSPITAQCTSAYSFLCLEVRCIWQPIHFQWAVNAPQCMVKNKCVFKHATMHRTFASVCLLRCSEVQVQCTVRMRGTAWKSRQKWLELWQVSIISFLLSQGRFNQIKEIRDSGDNNALQEKKWRQISPMRTQQSCPLSGFYCSLYLHWEISTVFYSIHDVNSVLCNVYRNSDCILVCRD